jgi:hypothetical protein
MIIQNGLPDCQHDRKRINNSIGRKPIKGFLLDPRKTSDKSAHALSGDLNYILTFAHYANP